MKKVSFFTRVNWRAYVPADEREHEVYNTAYRMAFQSLLGVPDKHC